jgi:glycine cleavage system aminomethyltransferase T
VSGVRITSAGYSPLFQRVLALGFVQADDAAPGTRIRLAPDLVVTTARLPFFDPAKYRARRTR